MCTGSLDSAFIFEAFKHGADGVFVGGCKLGECHYSTGNYHAKEKVEMTWEMLKKVGFDPERLGLAWLSSAEGEKFAAAIREFSEKIRAKGPSPLRLALEEVAS